MRKTLLCLVLAAFAGSLRTASAGEDNSHAPRLVTLEVLIVEATGGKRWSQLEGDSAEKLRAGIRELENQGQLAGVTRIRLVSVENQEAVAQFGETLPLTTSVMNPAGGRGGFNQQANFSYQNFGTLISVKPTVLDDDSVMLTLEVEKTGLARTNPAEKTEVVAPNQPPPARSVTLRTKGTLRLKHGEPQIFGAREVTTGELPVNQSLILVTAQVGPKESLRAAKPAAGPSTSRMKIFHLRTAQAGEVQSILRSVFEGREMRLAADVRTNSLIVEAGGDILAEIEAVIARLDE